MVRLVKFIDCIDCMTGQSGRAESSLRLSGSFAPDGGEFGRGLGFPAWPELPATLGSAGASPSRAMGALRFFTSPFFPTHTAASCDRRARGRCD